MTDTAPTLQERYARAMSSSHLEVQERVRGDIDVVIAAGWCSETMGTMLYRLASEFDRQRGEVEQARRYRSPLRDYISPLRAKARLEESRQKPSREKIAAFIEDSIADEKRALAEAACVEADVRASAHAFALMGLKSLNSTKEAFGRWAVVQATKQAYMQPDAVVLKLAGRVLDVWLDPLCTKCDGRGTLGEFGKPQTVCRACKGTGLRTTRLAETTADQQFGQALLKGMDEMMSTVERAMRGFLSQQ